MLETCAICGSIIWRATTGLCEDHRTFTELKSAVTSGEKSDWYPNTGGLVSHKEMALTPPDQVIPRTAWHVLVGDIDRKARYVLGDGLDNGKAA